MSACSGDLPRNVVSMYQDREELLRTFENVTVDGIRTSHSTSFIHDGLVNSYFFSIEKGKLKLENTHIQFDIKEFGNPFLETEDGIIEFVEMCVEKMKKYNIYYVTSQFKPQGIDLQFSMRKGNLRYVSDVNNITIPNWIEAIQSAKKLDDNWYWMSELR
jgi:hypothetical protein